MRKIMLEEATHEMHNREWSRQEREKKGKCFENSQRKRIPLICHVLFTTLKCIICPNSQVLSHCFLLVSILFSIILLLLDFPSLLLAVCLVFCCCNERKILLMYSHHIELNVYGLLRLFFAFGLLYANISVFIPACVCDCYKICTRK